MKLLCRVALCVSALCAFGLSAFGQKTQMMRVTAIEYHKKDTDTPYRVEGQTLSPGTILYYVLDCKKGAAGLHVGNTHYVAESTDEDGMKALLIYYRNPNESVTEATVIGVSCLIESVKAKK